MLMDKGSSDIPRLVLSNRDAAKALGISQRSLWKLNKTGEIPSIRIGGRVVYRVASLNDWLMAQEKETRATNAG